MIIRDKFIIIPMNNYSYYFKAGDTLKKGMNIMLSLMQLDIGGAETHVVELAKELKRRGFNIIVTSNGGAYVKELEEAGIKHYRVPMQNKNPLNVMKAIKRLRRIIIDEKIELVHSHARIPSFILGKMQKVMKFPFVTTAHWVFNTKYGLKYITDWGQKTVAVSEDIKTYLMDNYNVPEGNIRVTINGIDTDKFSPDTDCEDIKAELGIQPDDTVIVYVSRMDESRSLAAKHLIAAVPEADKLIENLKVVIVGGGDDLTNVKAQAEAVNTQLGRDCIVMTGARTDINRLIAPAELFVGVSRAALEAMAAEKPVIIAGNEGYIGLFGEDKLSIGIDTNFCCRGCVESSPELILADIKRYFAMDGDSRAELARYGRELIKRDYSIARMTDDTVKVYEWALDKNDEILVSGYYGFHNSGDDALLKALIADIKKYRESPELVVLSANPRETRENYRVKAVNRFNIPAILRHIKRADMLISGGGTLIQDATSTQSLIYYLTIIKLALKNKLKVMLYANGIGPLSGKGNVRRAAKVLNKVDIITLRDPAARDTLSEMGVDKPEIYVTADPVFGMNGADASYGREILAAFGVPVKEERVLGVSVRRTKNTDAGFEQAVAEICDYAAGRYGCFPVFIPMQQSRDEAISRSIMSRMRSHPAIIDVPLGVNEMISAVAALDLCLGMRLHSLIYATAASVPLIGIEYDPKIKSFMDYAGQSMCLDADRLAAEDGKRLIDECFKNYDSIKEQLSECSAGLAEKATENGRMAVELYERKE